MSGKRKALWAVIAVVIVGAVIAVISLSASNTTAVEVADVARGDLTLTVSAAGSIAADQQVDIYPPTSGTLASVLVEDGQFVHTGDVLAVMDTSTIEAQVAQAKAAYEGALAQRDAVKKAIPSATDMKAAEAGVTAAKAAYDAAKAAYDAAIAGKPSANDISKAQSAVAVAESAAEAAQTAYTNYYNNVYLPAAQPRDQTIETTLANLLVAKNEAVADLEAAKQTLAALKAARDNTTTIAQAKAARDQAYAAYASALSQQQSLAKAADVDTALDSAQAAVDAAKMALDVATETLKNAEITAPTDGYVLFSSSAAASLTGVTSAPTAGAAVTPASPLFALVSLDSVKFSAQVDETDIARIEPGMPAVVVLDAFPDDELTTTVDSIGKESEVTLTGGTVFPVVCRLEVGDNEVLLGMNGSVDIQVETIKDVITMPIEALLEEGGASYTYVVRDGHAYKTKIGTGEMTDTLVEVTSGLAEGDQVIVSGTSGLLNGAPVSVE